jgi:hypothetical protein
MYDRDTDNYYEHRTQKADAAFDAYLDLACAAGLVVVLYKLFQYLF